MRDLCGLGDDVVPISRAATSFLLSNLMEPCSELPLPGGNLSFQALQSKIKLEHGSVCF